MEHAFADMSAADAKKLGRKLPIRPDWEDVKFDIMREIVDSKFANNAYLKRKLLATGEEQLVERNWWHDNIWGDCACDRCKSKAGKNMLGIILMETRARLK